MGKAIEVAQVRVGPHGLIVTFSDGKVGAYSASLLAGLYAESEEIRNRQSPYGAREGISLVRKAAQALL